jgi:ABC-type nitrate/sulfonate/bicarbonate transport system ATPase subunit
MDEPFAALDNITRRILQELTCRVCDKYGVTVMFVTHSVEEAVRMAHKIAVMNKQGNIEKIFENPFRLEDTSEAQALLISEITSHMDKLHMTD